MFKTSAAAGSCWKLEHFSAGTSVLQIHTLGSFSILLAIHLLRSASCADCDEKADDGDDVVTR